MKRYKVPVVIRMSLDVYAKTKEEALASLGQKAQDIEDLADLIAESRTTINIVSSSKGVKVEELN